MKTLRTLPALLCAGFLGLSAQAAEDSRSGPLAGFGERLQRHGVKTHAQFWSLSLKNLDTGPRQHSFGNSGDLFLGADLDLATLAGLTAPRCTSRKPCSSSTAAPVSPPGRAGRARWAATSAARRCTTTSAPTS